MQVVLIGLSRYNKPVAARTITSSMGPNLIASVLKAARAKGFCQSSIGVTEKLIWVITPKE